MKEGSHQSLKDQSVQESYIMQRLHARNNKFNHDGSELSRYLNSPVVELTSFDPLSWWHLNQMEFPTLARMAQDILSIPLSSVSVERLFSSARDVIPYRRNRLSPEMLQNLLLLKSWYKNQGSRSGHAEEEYSIDTEDMEPDSSDKHACQEYSLLDIDFLNSMIPNNQVESDEEEDTEEGTEKDSDMESALDLTTLHTSFTSISDRSVNSRKRKAQDIPIINTAISTRLRKHVRRISRA